MAEYVCDMTDDYPGVPYGADEYSGTVERCERIVRCRDCVHAEEIESGVFGSLVLCDYWLRDEECKTFVEPDGFCSWGERRGE